MDSRSARRTWRAFVGAAALASTIARPASAQANTPVIGRWDLTVQGANGPYPS